MNSSLGFLDSYGKIYMRITALIRIVRRKVGSTRTVQAQGGRVVRPRVHNCPETIMVLSFCVNGVLPHGQGGLQWKVGDTSHRFGGGVFGPTRFVMEPSWQHFSMR